jgi:hypothetical protein
MPTTDNATGLGANSSILSSPSRGAESQSTCNCNSGETVNNTTFTGSVIILESHSNSATMPLLHPSPSNVIENNFGEQSDADEQISESREEQQSMNHIEPSPVDHVHFQNSEGSTCQSKRSWHCI